MKLFWILTLTVNVFQLCQSQEKRVVCYYASWSSSRPGQGQFLPENIDPYLCTHIIYAFAGVNKRFAIEALQESDVKDGYRRFTNLKMENPYLKTLLSMGGWKSSSKDFSTLANNETMRKNFARRVVNYLTNYGFDGLDLDWQFPGYKDGNTIIDKGNHVLLIKDLRKAFDQQPSNTSNRLLLTIPLPKDPKIVAGGYDIPSLNEYVDFYNVLSYDYRFHVEQYVDHHSPFRSLPIHNESEWNVYGTVQMLLQHGALPKKLVVGIPTYGRTFRLADPSKTDIRSPIKGKPSLGPYTGTDEYLAFYEILEKIKVSNWTLKNPYPDAIGPYAYKDAEWVAYDDKDMVIRKAEYVAKSGFGGIMFWTIDMDDFLATYSSQKFPLIKAGKAALDRTQLDPSSLAMTIRASTLPDNDKVVVTSSVSSTSVSISSSSVGN